MGEGTKETDGEKINVQSGGGMASGVAIKGRRGAV